MQPANFPSPQPPPQETTEAEGQEDADNDSPVLPPPLGTGISHLRRTAKREAGETEHVQQETNEMNASSQGAQTTFQRGITRCYNQQHETPTRPLHLSSLS